MPEKFITSEIKNKATLDNYRDNSLKQVKAMLGECSKMPDSWIDPTEHHIHSDEEREKLHKKMKNKFRVNYFHALGGNLFGLIYSMDDARKKEEYKAKLGDILERVKIENNENRKVPEELIDEIDVLANELINIFENKENG